MKHLGIFCLSLFFLFIVSSAFSQQKTQPGGLRVSSPVFENNGTIPKKYGCEGENVNPSLKIEHVPSGAKSIALVFDDIDAPRGTYVHWILWNIDPGTREIKENSIPEGAIQGVNDFKKRNYGGPCPPTRPHRYVFKTYVLDTLLDLQADSAKPDLEKAMEGHILGQAQLKGTYKRK
jgi:hypothetical protein